MANPYKTPAEIEAEKKRASLLDLFLNVTQGQGAPLAMAGIRTQEAEPRITPAAEPVRPTFKEAPSLAARALVTTPIPQKDNNLGVPRPLATPNNLNESWSEPSIPTTLQNAPGVLGRIDPPLPVPLSVDGIGQAPENLQPIEQPIQEPPRLKTPVRFSPTAQTRLYSPGAQTTAASEEPTTFGTKLKNFIASDAFSKLATMLAAGGTKRDWGSSVAAGALAGAQYEAEKARKAEAEESRAQERQDAYDKMKDQYAFAEHMADKKHQYDLEAYGLKKQDENAPINTMASLLNKYPDVHLPKYNGDKEHDETERKLFFESLPTDIAQKMKMVAEYRSSPKDFSAYNGGRNLYTTLAGYYNPYYDQTKYEGQLQRQKTSMARNGEFFKMTKNLDASIGHLETLQKIAMEYGGTSRFPKLNDLMNHIRRNFGDAKAREFETALNLVNGEITKAVTGSGTVHSLKEMSQHGLSMDMSTEAFLRSAHTITDYMNTQARAILESTISPSGTFDMSNMGKNTLRLIAQNSERPPTTFIDGEEREVQLVGHDGKPIKNGWEKLGYVPPEKRAQSIPSFMQGDKKIFEVSDEKAYSTLPPGAYYVVKGQTQIRRKGN